MMVDSGEFLLTFPSDPLTGNLTCTIDDELNISVRVSQRKGSAPMHHMNPLGQHPNSKFNLSFLHIGPLIDRVRGSECHSFARRQMSLKEGSDPCRRDRDSIFFQCFLNAFVRFFPLCLQKRISLVRMLLEIMDHGEGR